MPHEPLPADWPIAGTTGYEFLNQCVRLFVDPAGEAPLTDFYGEFSGESTDYPALAHDKKHLVMRDLFASDLNRLTAQLADMCENNPRYRDYTRRELNSMLREVIACLPVYRTYVRAEENQFSDTDRKYIDQSIDLAKAKRPELDGELFDFFRDLLLLQVRGQLEADLVMRFQQCSGAVMAKGIEDTLFYSYNRFVALNDVGSEPNWFAISPQEFHQCNSQRLAKHPQAMLTTATHDTKRGEDLRARLALLSEMPRRWSGTVRAWRIKTSITKRNSSPIGIWNICTIKHLSGRGQSTLSGCKPTCSRRRARPSCTRLGPRRMKNMNEALKQFIERTMQDQAFQAAVAQFVQDLIAPGRVNSLAQTLLKLTVPGVPDIYQGCELWDLHLVDPDNRMPVDFVLRRELLSQLEGLTPEQVFARSDEGLPKLWTIHRTLMLRCARSDLFQTGSYEPLTAVGNKAQHMVAFVRAGKAISIVPRLVLGLAGDWQNTTLELPPGQWQNHLTGDTLAGGRQPLAELLHRFPVALLVS